MSVDGAETNARWVAGGYKDEDELEGISVWDQAADPSWSLRAWHQSPREIQAEAAALNAAAFGSVNAAAGKHSQPPVPSHLRHL